MITLLRFYRIYTIIFLALYKQTKVAIWEQQHLYSWDRRGGECLTETVDTIVYSSSAPYSRSPDMADEAFVTLVTNDTFVKGALVLGCSLRKYNTTRKLCVLITPQVSECMRKVLDKVFDNVQVVDVLDSEDSARLALMERPELGITLTKLNCWTLIEYTKCVFMDADTIVLTNVHELFEWEKLSAAPDPGWPDCFNSGVFVYKHSITTYNDLLDVAKQKGSFDGGDQGLFNTFFHTWMTQDKHLPFLYNLSSVSIYPYLPAFKAFGENAKVVHLKCKGSAFSG